MLHRSNQGMEVKASLLWTTVAVDRVMGYPLYLGQLLWLVETAFGRPYIDITDADQDDDDHDHDTEESTLPVREQ